MAWTPFDRSEQAKAFPPRETAECDSCTGVFPLASLIKTDACDLYCPDCKADADKRDTEEGN